MQVNGNQEEIFAKSLPFGKQNLPNFRVSEKIKKKLEQSTEGTAAAAAAAEIKFLILYSCSVFNCF